MKEISVIFGFLVLVACSKPSSDQEEIVKKPRKTFFIYADPSFYNITQELTDVYEGINDSVNFEVVGLSEDLAIKKMSNDSASMVISSRFVTSLENDNIVANQKVCKDYVLAYDALAIIVNKSEKDSCLTEKGFLNLLSVGETDKRMVFDENYSSTIAYVSQLLKKKPLNTHSYAAKNVHELISVVSSQKNTIGLCGSNIFSNQDDSLSKEILKSVKVLGIKSKEYVAYPFQADVAAKKYPYTREIHILNSEHYYGPYSAFKNFAIGPIGQRVVLKSGLMPVHMPNRLLNFVKDKNE